MSMNQLSTFDTLAYAKQLKAVGFTEEQAEVQAEALAHLIDGKLASKQDLKNSEVALRRDIKELETQLKQDIKELETQLTRDIKELEMRLTIKLGTLLVVALGIFTTLIKVL